MSLRYRLFLQLLVTAVIPLTLLIVVNSILVRQDLEEQVVSHLVSVSEVQKGRLDEVVARQIDRIQLVSSRVLLRNSLRDYVETREDTRLVELQRILLDARTSVPEIERIRVFDVEGSFIVSDTGNTSSDSLELEALTRASQAPAVLDVSLDQNNDLTIVSGGPLLLDNQVIGIVEIVSSATPLLDITEDRSGLGETGEVIFGKKTGAGDAVFLLPLRFDAAAALTRTVPAGRSNVPIIAAVNAQESIRTSTETVDYRNEQVFAVTTYVDSLQWGMVVKMDRAEALAPINQLVRLFLVVLAASLLFVLSFALLGSLSLTRPLTRLTRVTRQIRAGDLSTRAPVTSGDEIGVLSRAFNDMADDLQQLYSNLSTAVSNRTAALSDEKGRIETILNSISYGVVVTNSEGNVLYVNPYTLLLLGRSEADIKDHDWYKIVQPTADKEGRTPYPEVALPLSKIRAGEDKAFISLQEPAYFLHSSGERMPVVVTASRIELQEGAWEAVLVFRDVTSEFALDKARSEFVSIASHELRTPLTAISGNVDLLLKGEAGTLAKESLPLLQDVATASDRLIRLVNDLLSVSRVELGRVDYNLDAVALPLIVSDTLKEFERVARAKALEVRILPIAPGLPDVQADLDKVRQIFDNLMDNAIKYTDHGSITIALERKDDFVEVRVQDTGIGMTSEEQEKVFDKFVRLSEGVVRDPNGSGLGLFISKAYVTAMYGDMRVESEGAGQGTTFVVRLPIADSPVAQKAATVLKNRVKHADFNA